jgi:hypothetical protein
MSSYKLDEEIFVPPGATSVLHPRDEETEAAYLRVVAEAFNFSPEYGSDPDWPIMVINAKRDLTLVYQHSLLGYESNASRTVTTIRFDAPGGLRQLFMVESRFGATPYRSLLLMHEGVVVDLSEYSQAKSGNVAIANAVKQLDSQVRKLLHPEAMSPLKVLGAMLTPIAIVSVVAVLILGLAELTGLSFEWFFFGMVATVVVPLIRRTFSAFRTERKEQLYLLEHPEPPRPI